MEKEEIMEARNLVKLFSLGARQFSLIGENFVHAVDGVSFKIKRGEVFGLHGESGCGKTTIGLLLSGLETPTSGKVIFEGINISDLNRRQFRPLRKKIQIIFQDPYESLNPRFKVSDTVIEPLNAFGIGSSARERNEIVLEMLKVVGLEPPEDFLGRHPYGLSGGQMQRVSIARAMVLRPQFMVADEPTSMLDASVHQCYNTTR